MPVSDDDWRLRGQERWLGGAIFGRANYRAPSRTWNHDHCEFCWATFMERDAPDVLREGYVTQDRLHWVCAACYEDFRETFEWSVHGSDA